MQSAAILLIIVSAIVHALWNLHGKSRQPSAAFFLIACLTIVPVAVALLVTQRALLGHVPAKVWLLVLLTGCFQALYYHAVAAAYRHGSLSVAYPLLRMLPVLMVPCVSVFLGRGGNIAPPGYIGFGLIAAGCLLLPMKHWTDLRWANYLNPCSVFAAIAAVGTTGYTVVDDTALRQLRPVLHVPATQVSALYLALLSLSTATMMTLWVGCRTSGRKQLRELWRNGWRNAALAGVGIWFSYGLVVAAMNFARDVSYIAAFRQLSVPLGAILGFVILNEPAPAPRVWGLVITVSGLALTAVG